MYEYEKEDVTKREEEKDKLERQLKNHKVINDRL